jgi:signal transduction histidine kinase
MRLQKRVWRQMMRACTALWPTPILLSTAALATATRVSAAGDSLYEQPEFIGVSAALALGVFGTAATLLHMAGRKSAAKREAALKAEINAMRARLDRAEVFLAAEPQVTICWGSSFDEPDIEGDVSQLTDLSPPRRLLAFGSWLSPMVAQQLERAVERLRERGEAFRLPLVTLGGRHLETEGRAVAGRAVMRIRDVSGDRLELTRLRETYSQSVFERDGLRAMLDSAPAPAWLRDPQGRLVWVNRAYVRAVEAERRDDVVARGLELLDEPIRRQVEEARGRSEGWRERVHAVVAGERRMLDVTDVPMEYGSGGIATDVSDLEQVRADLGRQMDAHRRTLDQLSTAVAIFDASRRLVFYNTAYAHLWSLDAAFLDQAPADSEILDRLRAEGRLPEQADFRTWKAGLMQAYQSVETAEHVWYLPGARTLRVVINPNPQGGVTYLFDDVTERFHLESSYNALMRVQGETLDSLKEGVAVFGTDGRLKLFNPAFAALWKCDTAALAEKPHFDQVMRACMALHDRREDWDDLRSLVAGMQDARTGFERRLTRRDGSIIDCVTAPLPDGATLLTFIDVSASVSVERALTERNQALLDAEKLRNDFVHHVSYELRSPLTNIIGFIQLLGEGAVGPLNPKQREYTGYVLKSSAALLAIINDILDLASIDTDAMELSLENVDIRDTISAAAEGLQDRLAESNIHLNIVALDDIGSFRADSKRIRQVLFNLLSNAIGFSEPGQTVTLAALRRPGQIVLKVSDQGRGIPLDVLDRVFDRFQTHTVGSRHRGVGLGLSIVRSFVELHGGEVDIQSAPGEGTVVTCLFPDDGVAVVKAASA